MKVFIIGAAPSSISKFRGELIKLLTMKGFDVCAIAAVANSEQIKEIENLGVDYLSYPVARNGINPIEDVKTYISLRNIFKQKQPNVILAYTIKPIIWGGMASWVIPHCRFYALITGLGFAFQKGSWKKNTLVKLVTFLYKIALKKSEKVIFQNPDNRQVFIDLGIIPAHKAYVVNGSGVDISHFEVKPLPSTPNFLLIARLLGDKGIREYIKAADIVKEKYSDVLFQLVGPEDPSPDGITLTELAHLNSSGNIDYLGPANDVRPYIEGCSIFVLPSYHEGLPRTVLEAMATGRPILTTDVPGCRETVVNGENGWLIQKANAEHLAERMIWCIENQNNWQCMGNASRKIVEDKFNVHIVNKELFKIMELD